MKTPTKFLDKFEKASTGIEYGTVTMTLSIKQRQQRYIIAKEESFLLDEEPSTHTETGVKTKVKCLVGS